jgi:hypothetical protein
MNDMDSFETSRAKKKVKKLVTGGGGQRTPAKKLVTGGVVPPRRPVPTVGIPKPTLKTGGPAQRLSTLAGSTKKPKGRYGMK